jgi:hypothetical protein
MEPRLANHLFLGWSDAAGLSLYAELLTVHNVRSESNIFTIKPSANDNPFILAQANRNFTNGLNDTIKNLTRDIFNKVRNSLENNLR